MTLSNAERQELEELCAGYKALWKYAKALRVACKQALAFLRDDDARSNMSDAGYAHYDDVVDALESALYPKEDRS